MDTLALKALLDAHPASLDMGLLKPLKDQLGQVSQVDDPEVAELAGMLQQAVDMLSDEQIKRLNALATEMQEEFDKAVKSKKDVELRWIDDERQYNGNRRIRDSKAYPNDAGDKWRGDNERPTLHATRSKTLRYTARLIDMMLPGNDLPMKVEPTPNPDPECFPALPQDMQPEDLKNYASDCAGRMQSTIKDQLSEQKFHDVGRRVIHDACRLGCGISKGPFMDYRKRRKPKGPNSEIVLDESPIPGYAYVDPWFFYYDMARSLDESSRCFEVHLMDKRQLNDLKRYPRMIEENIDLLMKEEDPKLPPSLSASILNRNRLLDAVEPVKNRWAVIEMHGVIDIDVLENTMGMEWPDKNTLPLIELWFCDGKALKWKLSPLECDWRVPYYNLTPFPCDDSIFGHGIAYMARGGQKIVDGALDATLVNATASAGAYLFFKKGAIQPMDERWVLTGPKPFNVTSDEGPISDAFGSVIVPSNVDGNLELLDRGLDFMDQDILIDQIVQGDINHEDVPASGLLQLINLATIFQRMIAARADDSWFKPMAERWVQWNIQYNEDASIKGDFDAKGVASTTLVSKDLQLQHLQLLMTVSGQPQYAGMTDNWEILSSYSRMLDIPNRDALLYDKKTAEQNAQQIAQQNQGGDPLKAQELQIKAQELQLKAKEVEYAHAERMAEIERQKAKDASDAIAKQQDNATKILVANAQKQTALIGFATQKDTSVAQIAQAVQKAAMDNDTKQFVAALEHADNKEARAADTGVKIAQMAQDNQHKAADLINDHAERAHEAAMQAKDHAVQKEGMNGNAEQRNHRKGNGKSVAED